jgi:hypothetical protein
MARSRAIVARILDEVRLEEAKFNGAMSPERIKRRRLRAAINVELRRPLVEPLLDDDEISRIRSRVRLGMKFQSRFRQ